VSRDAGFSLNESVISPQECVGLIADLSAAGLPRTRAGARHLLSFPPVAAIARDSRLTRIAAEALGRDAVPFRATLFDKSPTSNWLIPWHQDTALPIAARFDAPGWGPWSRKGGVDYAHAPSWALERVIALRLHLDDCTARNGPLRVIAGSHHAGVLCDEKVAEEVRHNDHIECVIGRGGVLAMRPLLLHSSSKVMSDAPRRVVHIEYVDALGLAAGIRLAVG